MFHGNWCGPFWSNGRLQPSVRGGAPAVDEFDETCRRHDFVYADSGNLRDADLLFAGENFGRGITRTIAAVGVGIQGLLRPIDKFNPTIYQDQEEEKMVNNNSQKLRGATPVSKALKSRNGNGSNGSQRSNGISSAAPPTAFGTIIRATPPTMTRTLNDARLVGRDFIGTVEGQGVSTFGVGKSALLSPAYFASTMLGNLARSFEKYRWNKLRIGYVPKVATTLTGQLILASSKSCSEPCLAPEAGSFLQRAMSQGNAVFSPLWMHTYIDIDCDGSWKLVDPTTTGDLDDNIHEELQVFTQVSSAQQCGYLYAEYDVSFQEPIYQPHSTSIPIATGPGQRVIIAETAGVNAPLDDWLVTEPAGLLNLSTVANGTIYRGVFDLQGTTVATGATAGNLVTTATFSHGTTTTFLATQTNLPLVGGTTLYFVVQGTSMEVYSSMEQAITGIGSGQLFVRTATTVAGAYNFDFALVRVGNNLITTVQ